MDLWQGDLDQLVDASRSDTLAGDTLAVIDSGALTLHEPAFQREGVIISVDALRRSARRVELARALREYCGQDRLELLRLLEQMEAEVK